MSEFGESLVKSAKQAAEIAKGAAKPGTYRVTKYVDGEPHVIADFSEEVLAQVDAVIATEREAETAQPEQKATPAITGR